MSTTTVTSVSEFEGLVNSSGGRLVVVHFSAGWAPQCGQMHEVAAQLAKDYPAVAFAEVDAENVAELSEKYEVTAVPTVVLIKKSKVIDRVNGANPPELMRKVQANAAVIQDIPLAAPPSTTTPTNDKEDLNAKLFKLINAAPVMLFMKGSPDEPQCGFSRSMMELLRQQDIQFSSFNILADEQVRQGLKTYSNWPTYPQLYINGQLVGGIDIAKELAASGELKNMVPKAKTQEDLNSRLKSLINQDRVMLFMKGSPETPRCGFSRTMVSLLQEQGVKFGHYDILGDEEVRQGLKTYSNWPTYPQLYVDGSLIGGLDIVKEMIASGEFADTMKPKNA